MRWRPGEPIKTNATGRRERALRNDWERGGASFMEACGAATRVGVGLGARVFDASGATRIGDNVGRLPRRPEGRNAEYSPT